jgi:HK97 family phage portal protein
MARLEKIVVRDDAPERSWRDRLGDAWRSFTLGPLHPRDREIARLFGGAPVYSGVQVNEEAAFACSTFASAVFLISWDIASLPLFHYKKLGGGGKERSDSRLNTLLHDQANPETTAFDFRSAILINALAGGNGYAEIERDVVGRPLALWHLEPSRVTPFYDRGRHYRIAQPNGGEIILPAQDVLHLKGPSYNTVVGFDTVRLAREALGLTIAAERFGATFFSNGTSVGGILTTDALTPQARENLKAALQARHQGSANAHKWLHVESDSKFQEIGTNPRDSQFIELRTFQLREVARFLRVPVSMLGDLERSTFANQEQELLKYFKNCLRPWLVNIEQEYRSKLIPSVERNVQTIEHVVDGFLRADTEQRGSFYSAMLDRGVMSINEVRALENLPPIDGGDTPRVPMNTEPLRAIRGVGSPADIVTVPRRREE